MISGGRRRRAERSGGDDAGFVLLVVLSAVALLAVVAAGFAGMSRVHVRGTAAAVEGRRAEALADAGVHLAVLDLLQARADRSHARRFALDGTPSFCGWSDGGLLAVSVQDEAGKVDVNSASDQLLRALVAGLGLRDAVADAILDFRDGDDVKRAGGAERDEYRTAGRSHGPKNAPLIAVEELQLVLGLTAADAARLLPFLTLYSGQSSIDPDAARPGLLEALARGQTAAGLLGSAASDKVAGTVAGPLPSAFVSPSIRRVFSVRSQGRSASGAIFVREAIVELGRGRSQSFSFRRWRRGALLDDGQASADPPPC